MNICFYCQYNGGGTERATAILAERLAHTHNVIMLSTSMKEPTFSHQGVAFEHLCTNGILNQITMLSKYLRNNKIDILVSLEALSGITAIPASKLAGCKLIIWEHANYYQDQGSRNTHKLRKIDLLMADGYVVLTKRDLNNFKKHFKHIRTKIRQIYNIAELNNNTEYNCRSKRIISVGHINYIKNFIVIPDIAKEIFKEFPDWTWEIYGDVVGDEYKRIREKLDQFGLDKKVIFCGYIVDKDKIYKDAALYVMTSKQEGFPMVLLEAQEYRLPIVSFNIETGPDEIVDDGINGILIDAYDINKMKESIMLLMRDTKLREKYSLNAQNNFANLSMDKIVAEWETLLEEI